MKKKKKERKKLSKQVNPCNFRVLHIWNSISLPRAFRCDFCILYGLKLPFFRRGTICDLKRIKLHNNDEHEIFAPKQACKEMI